jgi:protein required for attachment to host cells
MPRKFAANPLEGIRMADTKKMKKTTAKSSNATTKTATKNEKAVQVAKPTREEIERLAKSYWAARGGQDGYAEQDWLRAEKELLKAASAKRDS